MTVPIRAVTFAILLSCYLSMSTDKLVSAISCYACSADSSLDRAAFDACYTLSPDVQVQQCAPNRRACSVFVRPDRRTIRKRKSITGDCQVTWRVNSSPQSYGQLSWIQGRTLEECKEWCVNLTSIRCDAIDFRADDPSGFRCYLRLATHPVRNISSVSGTTQYTRHCEETTPAFVETTPAYVETTPALISSGTIRRGCYADQEFERGAPQNRVPQCPQLQYWNQGMAISCACTTDGCNGVVV